MASRNPGVDPGAQPRETTSFVYDDNDNLRWRRTPRTDPSDPGQQLSFQYRYTSLDELSQETNPDLESWKYDYEVVP